MIINKKMTFLFVSILLTLSVSAIGVDYYYSPSCGHCQQIAPFLQGVMIQNNQVVWRNYDVSQGSYNIGGTPTLKIKTDDKREITLMGSMEIPSYLECELNEMSTLDCPTTSHLNCTTNSYFIR